MKKKATLIIQHLEKIYTMIPPHFPRVNHGFIAFHHDNILDVDTGDGWQYVDKDTRLIDGRNHIAIPGFIDVSISTRILAQTHAQTLRKLRELGEIRMKNGTLIANITKCGGELEKRALERLQMPFEFDYLKLPQVRGYQVVYPLQDIPQTLDKRICISTGTTTCLDQLLCAKLVHQYTTLDAMHIIAACTIYPAKALHLSNVGCIKKHYLGNVLLLDGNTIAEMLATFHGALPIQVIKEGTRILPNIII